MFNLDNYYFLPCIVFMNERLNNERLNNDLNNIPQKQFSNFDIFNDVERSAYSKQGSSTSMDNPVNDLNKGKPNRFETDIMLNGKTKFQDSNTIINSLQDEILTLKEKMKFVYEKDEEIQKLKYEIDKMSKEASELASNRQELFRLKEENRSLRDEVEKGRGNEMKLSRLESENTMLKEKLKDSLDSLEKDNTLEKEDVSNDVSNDVSYDVDKGILLEEDKLQIEIKEERVEEIKDDLIHINILNLKNVLANRLKSTHERHIDNLIQQYKIENNSKISKSIMEKMLKEAIHL